LVLQLSHTPATRCLFALAEGAAAALGPAARDFAPAFRFAVIEGRGGGDRAGGTGRHRECRALVFQVPASGLSNQGLLGRAMVC